MTNPKRKSKEELARELSQTIWDEYNSSIGKGANHLHVRRFIEQGFIAGYDAASDRIRELEEVLSRAKEKLQIYRENHSGEYVGGTEYQYLIKLINRALGIKDGNE